MDGDASNGSRGALDGNPAPVAATPAPATRAGDGRAAGIRAAAPSRLFLAALVAIAAAGAAGWYAYAGRVGLTAAVVGALFGALVIAVGRWFVARQRSAGTFDLIRETLVGSFASVALFLGGVVLLSQVWKPGLVPATITALVLYLAWKFQEVLALPTSVRRGVSGRRAHGDKAK
jgi:hypothetical protein